jgi:uncharacterized protein with NRDE domain
VCTLLLLRGAVPGFPLVLAMNRDEFLDRPSGGPRVWPGSPPVVAPIDLRGGGTWCGVSARGHLVAVTNRGDRRDAAKRSRGALTLDLLRADSVDGARAALEAPGYASGHNAFHALVADGSTAFLAQADEAIRVTAIGDRFSVVTNAGLGRTEEPKAVAAAEALRAADTTTIDAAVRDLEAILRRHDVPICRHQEDRGTRSSTLVALHVGGLGRSVLRFADGAPCSATYEDRSDLLKQLAGGPWPA